MSARLTESELREHCAAHIDDAQAIEVIMATDAALREELAQVTGERDALKKARHQRSDYAGHHPACLPYGLGGPDPEPPQCHPECQLQRAEIAEAQLTQAQAELTAYREGGVTEDILRRQDGYLKVGRGCVVVREEDWTFLQAENARLREKP